MPVSTRAANRISLWIAAIGLILIVPMAVAQEAAPDAGGQAAKAQPAAAPDSGSTDTEADKNETIMDMVLSSGPTGWTFMIVLILFSIVAVMVSLERTVNTQRSKIIPSGFVRELNALTTKEEANAESFSALCSRWTAPVAKILGAGLLRSGRPLPEVEKSMEDAAAREMAAIRGRVRPLSVVGAVAPLVGLLGTVLGMIMAFRTASQGNLGRGETMAQGIYMALLTTAAGLTIAIPCLLLAALFNSKVEKFFREIDESLMNTMPCFARMENAESTDVKLL